MKTETNIEYSCIFISSRVIKLNGSLGIEISCKIEARVRTEGPPALDIHQVCEIPTFILHPSASMDAQIDAFLNALENKYDAPIERRYLEYQCKYMDDYEWEF